MEKVNYPNLSIHKLEHADMRIEIKRRTDKILGSEIAFTDMIELYLFVSSVYNKHVNKIGILRNLATLVVSSSSIACNYKNNNR